MDILYLLFFCVSLLLAIITIAVLYYRQAKHKRMVERADQLRSDIFTKITHEFRTPLTIILGLSKQIREQKNLSNGNLATYLNAIERQGKNLSELVNQLLDIVNLQTTPSNMERKTGNLVAFVEMVAETFRIHAGQKDIELFFYSNETEIETDFVPDFLKKILYNLLSNAVKYSDEGSKIQLILERIPKERKEVVIKVIDHGKGIHKEMLPHIFDLFYKCPNAGKEKSDSKGIGLALVKQLTEALGGRIHVESEEGKGSTFTVEIPLMRDEKQLYAHWKPETTLVEPKENMLPQEEVKENDPRARILLAEDNRDIALYVRSLFHHEQYNVLHASNGEKAWEIANQFIPDILITDVMMPKKNGIELCNDIKDSPLLNHIPVVIISAKNTDADLLEGLKSGADSYIRKPFYPEELRIRVEKLLENRQLLREKYGRTLMKKETAESNGSDNQKNADFLRHATDIIYREIKNPNFTPGKLAQELALSVSQLNKKMNAITGYPPSIYILQVRLSHAKKIFTSQNKTIGEVAAECGIIDVNYFSRIFKKHTGFTPTQFKRLPQQ